MLPSSFAMSLIELIREQAGMIARLVSLIRGLVDATPGQQSSKVLEPAIRIMLSYIGGCCAVTPQYR